MAISIFDCGRVRLTTHFGIVNHVHFDINVVHPAIVVTSGKDD